LCRIANLRDGGFDAAQYEQQCNRNTRDRASSDFHDEFIPYWLSVTTQRRFCLPAASFAFTLAQKAYQ